MSNINIEEALESLFSEYNSEYSILVDLPSKGKGYKVNNKSIKIKAMNFDDEKFIASYRGDDLIDQLLLKCSDVKDLDELYIEDKLFLYFKLREASFGSTFKMESECIHCGFLNSLEIDINKLKVDYAEDTFTDPTEVMLPMLKKSVSVTKMRSYLQEYSSSEAMLLENLWRFIKKIDHHEDPVLIAQAIKKLSSKDIRTIMSAINTKQFGLDTRAMFVCSKCNKENVASVGLSFDFFTES
tara:strand:+ start:602 stop:1324 length:723 start_codon:yes stop_codon:yes gene_type:complete